MHKTVVINVVGLVTGWYASFLENVVISNAALFSNLAIFGETLVGLAP